MSFRESYESLEMAFATSNRADAVLGDIFLPNPTMPDLEIPIGVKLENTEVFNLERNAGALPIATTCRIILLDHEKIRPIIDPIEITTWQKQPTPNMYFKQTVSWVEETENGSVAHATRLFRGFTKGEMQAGDDCWDEYAASLESNEHGQHFEPLFFNTHGLTDPIIDSTKTYSIDDHAVALCEIGRQRPELAPLTSYGEIRGREMYLRHTAEQFASMTSRLVATSL